MPSSKICSTITTSSSSSSSAADVENTSTSTSMKPELTTTPTMKENDCNTTTTTNTMTSATSEDYLNKKIAFIQNHINNLLIEITNLPEPWTYAVTEDGRVFFINEDEQRTTWLHPRTGQPVSVMIIPPLEDLPTGWQKDYILGLPYLIDHNSRQNFIASKLNQVTNNNSSKIQTSAGSSSLSSNSSSPKKIEEDCEKMKSKIMNSILPTNDNEENNSSPNGKLSDLENNNTTSTSSTSSHSLHSSNLLNNNNNNNNNNINLAVDSALRKYGWLYKLSQNGFKLWRKRYFVLTDYILDYYSDSTMNKHCGTIFLNGTRSRTTIKKDGSSANNKKNSFKVELVTEDGTENSNDMFIYLAAESSASMNEWINKFNFVSKLKDNTRVRNSLSDKQYGTMSNRSGSISSLKSNSNMSSFIIKHDNSKKSNKSNSAPSSPNLNKSSNSKSNNSKNSTSKILLSNMKHSNENGEKKVIKKLAFSDNEILNDNNNKVTANTKKEAKKSNKIETEIPPAIINNEENNSKKISNKNNTTNHKRSISLTRPIVSCSSSSNSNSTNKEPSNKNGNSAIYDYKSIYDAFEKPIKEMNNSTVRSTLSNKSDMSARYRNSIYAESKQSNQPLLENYLCSEKMAAASAAAMAAAAAIATKEKNLLNNKNNYYSNTNSPNNHNHNSNASPVAKVINNFYTITRKQIESLPKNEVQMLVRQLRRNFVLLNHSQQRFTLLHKLFEPYELIYQHKQIQTENDKKSDDTLTHCLHDSYKTMRDRIIKVEMRMDSVEDSLKTAQQYNDSTSSSPLSSDEYNSSINSKYSSYFRLYEYQIVEMQHEYELLLEDKIIIDKLLDNQMKIFSKYKHLTSEKTLVSQFNALTQEMDVLKMQLTKINQLLNDTIAEKCKQELKHVQQLQDLKTKKKKENAETLFRADLVPIGNVVNEIVITPKTVWKLNNSNDTKQHNSIENLVDNKQNYCQVTTTPKSNLNTNLNKSSNNFNPNHHYYCLNNNDSFAKPNLKLDSNISKSIDSIYTPPSSLNGNVNPSNLTNSLMNGSAFNMTKKSIQDDLHTSFQPVNFTNNRPNKQQQHQQQPNNLANQSIHSQTNKMIKETRDFIAEKKRASIGKYPQNLNYQYFQPIPVQHCPAATTAPVASSQQKNQSLNSLSSSTLNTNSGSNSKQQQTARERLFGSVNSNSIYNQQQQQQQYDISDQMSNSRKIAMVKPELRGSCENELIQRFTQQNQMEYFDADYSEEIFKNINKPDIYQIPRGSLDLEPEADLTEEELRAKEKRMLEIKKMIALQSLQQIFVDDINNCNTSNNNNNTYYKTNNYADLMHEKEKREQLLDLRHEVAEQIKEKSRQAMSASLIGSSNHNAFISSTSIPIEIDHKSTNESKSMNVIENTPNIHEFLRNGDYAVSSIDKKRQQLEQDYYSMQMMSESVLNSTPAPPTPNFHAIFNLNNYNVSSAELQ